MNGKDTQLREPALQALCGMVLKTGSDYTPFIPLVDKIIKDRKIQHERYDSLMDKLRKNQAFTEHDKHPPGYADQKTYNHDFGNILYSHTLCV